MGELEAIPEHEAYREEEKLVLEESRTAQEAARLAADHAASATRFAVSDTVLRTVGARLTDAAAKRDTALAAVVTTSGDLKEAHREYEDRVAVSAAMASRPPRPPPAMLLSHSEDNSPALRHTSLVFKPRSNALFMSKQRKPGATSGLFSLKR